jgi:hypothetical protein
MTPEDALLASARVIGWIQVPAGRDAPAGVVLVRRVGDRVDVVSFMSAVGPATITGQRIGGPGLWRYEVPVRVALAWATGEFADDAPLAALQQAHDEHVAREDQ